MAHFHELNTYGKNNPHKFLLSPPPVLSAQHPRSHFTTLPDGSVSRVAKDRGYSHKCRGMARSARWRGLLACFPFLSPDALPEAIVDVGPWCDVSVRNIRHLQVVSTDMPDDVQGVIKFLLHHDEGSVVRFKRYARPFF